MSAIETSTDMREFEDVLRDGLCHAVPAGSVVALCGHSDERWAVEPVHEGSWKTAYCSGCGKRNCPKCQLAGRGMGL